MKSKFYGGLGILYPLFKSSRLSQRIKVTLYVAVILSMLIHRNLVAKWTLIYLNLQYHLLKDLTVTACNRGWSSW